MVLKGRKNCRKRLSMSINLLLSIHSFEPYFARDVTALVSAIVVKLKFSFFHVSPLSNRGRSTTISHQYRETVKVQNISLGGTPISRTKVAWHPRYLLRKINTDQISNNTVLSIYLLLSLPTSVSTRDCDQPFPVRPDYLLSLPHLATLSPCVCVQAWVLFRALFFCVVFFPSISFPGALFL